MSDRRGWARELGAALATLPQPLQSVVRCRYFSELSEAQTIRRTGLSEAEVRNSLAAALQQLGRTLADPDRHNLLRESPDPHDQQPA